jgi:hypothetical protein
VRTNEIQSSTTAFNLCGKRFLRTFVELNTPFFSFKKTIATFAFEVLALLGND